MVGSAEVKDKLFSMNGPYLNNPLSVWRKRLYLAEESEYRR